MLLTKSRIQHVQCHSVALLGTRDCDQALIAVVLGFVDLNNTSADLSNLVDLLSTLANNGTDHVVGDVDLLGQWGTGHTGTTVHGLLTLRSSMGLRCCHMTAMLRRHVRSGTIATGGLGGVVQRSTGSRLRHGAVVRRLLLRIGVGRQVVVGSRIRTSAVVLALSKVASGRLGAVWDDLHTARDDTSGATTARGICRGCRSTEALIELLQKCTSDVIGSDMHSVGYTHYYERALGGQRQTRVRGIESGARGFLNLTNSDTTLADDGSDEHVRNQKTEGIRL